MFMREKGKKKANIYQTWPYFVEFICIDSEPAEKKKKRGGWFNFAGTEKEKKKGRRPKKEPEPS